MFMAIEDGAGRTIIYAKCNLECWEMFNNAEDKKY